MVDNYKIDRRLLKTETYKCMNGGCVWCNDKNKNLHLVEVYEVKRILYCKFCKGEGNQTTECISCDGTGEIKVDCYKCFNKGYKDEEDCEIYKERKLRGKE